MSSSEVLQNEDSSPAKMYRPEVYKLEQQWRRKKEEEEEERMAKLASMVEQDSGMCEDAISGRIPSVERVQESHDNWKEMSKQDKRDNKSLRGPSERLRESRHESGFETMEVLSFSEDPRLEEPSVSSDESIDDGDLIDGVEMPKPVVPEPEEVDDSPTPGQSVYHYFAVSEDPRYFLAVMRPFIMAQDEEGDTSLHHAVIHNRLPALYRLMDVLADTLWYCVNVQNRLGQTVLHLSVALKQYTAIRKFIEADARLDVQDVRGNSPVHIACRNGDLRAMKELLSDVQTPEGKVMTYEPEDLNRRNFSGLSPMHLATLSQSSNCVRYLKELGADVDVEDGKRNSTPLHYAVEMQNLGLVTFLVFECGADVNAITSDGCSPLHLACGYGLDAIVALLVAAGADVTVPNDEGDMPEDIATTNTSKSLCTPFRRKVVDVVNGFSSMDITEDALSNSFDLAE